MGAIGARRVTPFNAYLRLARISNLPTVWTNVLAASVLSGGPVGSELAVVMLAVSLLYTAGMLLNDAFDQEIDAKERPTRPLPSRTVSSSGVWVSGFAMLAAGALLPFGLGIQAGIAALALAGTILVYDAWHKGNTFAPLIMGLCRALVYVTTAAATGLAFSQPLIAASISLLAYVAAITFVAKEESFDRVTSWWPVALLALPLLRVLTTEPPTVLTALLALFGAGVIASALRLLSRRGPGDVGRAVSLLIAAIALFDGLNAAAAGNAYAALICCGLFVLTILLQRIIPGT
ncbi:MAG: prenyltransferase [Hyphomicrobium sp.]|nr:MAG: prenyltransferase [Hyphomicrobium sp.]